MAPAFWYVDGCGNVSSQDDESLDDLLTLVPACSWARPVSASLTAEDCEPPGQCSGLDDVDDGGDIIDDDSPGWRCILQCLSALDQLLPQSYANNFLVIYADGMQSTVDATYSHVLVSSLLNRLLTAFK